MQLSCYTSFICIFVQLVLSDEELPDAMKKRIIMNNPSRDADRMEGLTGRASFSRRKTLPSGDIFSNKQIDNLRCGNTYPVSKVGHYYFNLSPHEQPCDYTFLGSRNERCNVAVLCNEKITLAPPSNSGCDKEWLVLSDGSEGLMSGCGSFSFSGTPRVSRNNGTDLYFFLKGTSPTRCIAFCIQDLTTSHKGIKPARRISKNKQYQGFKMETGCKCGIRKDFGRVVGGETAFKFEFPWIGSIVFKGAGYERQPFCGGSLVSDRYFLSAAHCFAIDKVKAYQIQVVLHAHVMDKRYEGNNPDESRYKKIPGWNLPDETDESEHSVRMDVQEIKNHPLFNDRTFDFDIAILEFTRAVNLKKGKLAPICLPYMHEFFSFEDDTTMVVAGWGRPWEGAPTGARILQKLEVPYMNLKDCAKYTLPSKRHVCAGYTEGGKDACGGDSGGPLIYQFNRDDNQYLLTGVVSAGDGCARKNTLGLYTDVQELLQWTYHHMPDALYCPRN